MSTADLMKSLHIANYPKRWDFLYEALTKEYLIRGCVFLQQEYLVSLNREYRIFERTLAEILAAAAKTREKPDLVRYIMLLNLAMKDRIAFKTEVNSMEPPLAPVGEDTTPYDFALLFAVLPYTPEIDKGYREHCVPSDVRYATLTAYEECMFGYRNRFDRFGFDVRYLNWIQLYIDERILRIGRLNFEMRPRFGSCVNALMNNKGEIKIMMTDMRIHRRGGILGNPGYADEDGAYDAKFVETEDYYEGHLVRTDGYVNREPVRLSKSDWHIALSGNDPVLSIHIPAGQKLSFALCESSYARAREIFTECYSDFGYKAFVCFSWLMDPQLALLLPPDSNIITFQSKFTRFPRPCSGKAVLNFVFFNRFNTYENLPENTSLERSLKRHYLDGKYIYESGGVFF